MQGYTNGFLSYYAELDKICEEKKFDNKTIKVLKQWFLYVLCYYKSGTDILNHFSIEEYIEYNFEKLRQTKDIKVLELKEILINPQCSLYKCIKKIPFDMVELTPRFSKQGTNFILDNNGEYYLNASGVCRGDKTIELVDGLEAVHVLQHELQHVNQNYAYSSEFPFANDMLEMLNEGEAEYHYHLLDGISNFHPIEEKNTYYTYYLVYTLLMFIVPKGMRNSWNKIDRMQLNSNTFSDIFKDIIFSEENKNNFSHIFALATLIVASCNSEHTKEIFNASVETSIKRCSNRVESWDHSISLAREVEKKNNLEGLKYATEEVRERIKVLQNPELLLKKYKEIIFEAKEFVVNEPKEKQEELLQELQIFTLEKFESQLKDEVKRGEESIQKYQNKKERLPQEILGEEAYRQYHYYQFGMKLNKKMQVLLNQKLSFTELFEQFLEKIESNLIESKDPGLDEKLSFIDKIRMNCLVDPKKI